MVKITCEIEFAKPNSRARLFYARGLTGGGGGDGEVRFFPAASLNEVYRAFTSAPYPSAFCPRLVFGEFSSVGFALRCCCMVFSIFCCCMVEKSGGGVKKEKIAKFGRLQDGKKGEIKGN